MPVGGLIAGVASLGSAAIGAYSANKAAKQQAKAANKAQETQLEMYRQSREDLAPYRGVGEQGAYSLADMFGFKTPNNPDGSSPFAEKAWGAFKETPYYTVPYKEGMSAIDSSAAALELAGQGAAAPIACIASKCRKSRAFRSTKRATTTG